jgi:hypothetical protein
MPRAEFQRLQPSGLDENITRRDFEDLQQNITQLVDSLYELAPILDGRRIDGIELTGTGNDIDVPHKLGRKYQDWFVLSSTVTGGKPGDFTAEADKGEKIVIRGSTQTLSIWVF